MDVGLSRSGEVDELGGQPIAQLEAIRHEIARVGAESAQRSHADRAGGRAVGVVVCDDQQALLRGDGVGEELRALVEILQQARREEACRLVAQLTGGSNAARRKEACEQRVHTGRDQCLAIPLGVAALDQLHA